MREKKIYREQKRRRDREKKKKAAKIDCATIELCTSIDNINIVTLPGDTHSLQTLWREYTKKKEATTAHNIDREIDTNRTKHCCFCTVVGAAADSVYEKSINQSYVIYRMRLKVIKINYL